MNKEMIISSGAHDTRVAILEDDQVVEIFIERENQRGVVGNIYKGRVSKVLPGMQSSFVDIGLERDAFLYVTEVINTVEEFERLAGDDDDEDEDKKAHAAVRLPDPAAEGAQAAAEGAVLGARRAGPRRAQAKPADSRGGGPPRPRPRPGSRSAPGQDRRPAEGRAGDPRPGRQGAARHQGRAAHLARHDAGALPRLHADGRSRRRLAEDRVPRGALAAPQHRQAVPRAARLHRRRHHPHRGERPVRGRHRRRPVVLPRDLDRSAPQDGEPPSAGGAVPGAEPRHQAAARHADRRLHGHPPGRRGGAPARGRAGRAHHAEPAAAREAATRRSSRSSRSTGSRRRSTRRSARRCGSSPAATS